jgi:hypothetical protein
MRETAFGKRLKEQGMTEAEVDSALSLIERFKAAYPATPYRKEDAWTFAEFLINQGENTEFNLIVLARFALFHDLRDLFIGFLEMLDGGEAHENLYHRLAERFGEAIRDQVFDGIGVAPLGLPTPDKAPLMQNTIERLESIVGSEKCREFLSECLRDLPPEMHLDEKKLYESCADIDEFLVKRKEQFVAQLQRCHDAGRLFFVQEITQQVIDYVQSESEMGGGVRDGDIVYETKIPYLTKEFLNETDPAMKRYYCCHCPWAREAIKSGGKLTPIFCNCSAGFHKKPWEAVLGRPVKAEVLESVLNGDIRCRFAIHIGKR